MMIFLPLMISSCQKSALERVFPAGGSAQDLTTPLTSIKKFYLYLPKDYYSSNKQYPVIIFLHGNSQRGNPDPNVLTQLGVPGYALNNGDFPFIVIAPLLTEEVNGWDVTDLNRMFNEATTKFRMDLKRINVTGFSIGGSSAWIWASSNPGRFASLSAIGCYADENVCNLKSVPVWEFHNRYDTIYQLSVIQKSINDLIACGGSVKFTIYDDGGHEGWTKAYSDPALYTWMAAQAKP